MCAETLKERRRKKRDPKKKEKKKGKIKKKMKIVSDHEKEKGQHTHEKKCCEFGVCDYLKVKHCSM